MMASTPRASSQRASSTVVADESTFRAPRTDACQQILRRQSEVKADDGRFEIGERVRGFRVERRSPRARQDLIRIDAALREIRRERGPPRRLPPNIFRRLGVTEEVYIERLRRLGADRRQLVADVVDREERAGQGAEAARVRHRDRECTALNARHGRLNDGQLDSQKFLEAWGHVESIGTNFESDG